MTGKMFSFITKTWNPVRYCSHGCSYCWAKRFGLSKSPQMNWAKLYGAKTHGESDFVFACDVGDLFCRDVPSWHIEAVMEAAGNRPSKYLFLTKNPERYILLSDEIAQGENYWLGATIETHVDHPEISYAPLNSQRLQAMKELKDYFLENPRFVSIEPIMDFDLPTFVREILKIMPRAVAVGYDNYSNRLPEPSLEKAMLLIRELERAGIIVYQKTLRKAWWEGASA